MLRTIAGFCRIFEMLELYCFKYKFTLLSA